MHQHLDNIFLKTERQCGFSLIKFRLFFCFILLCELYYGSTQSISSHIHTIWCDLSKSACMSARVVNIHSHLEYTPFQLTFG